MTYVPVGPPPVESPRVRELSQRLAEVIEEYERQYPMSAGEVRQALRIAGSKKAGGGAGTAVAVAAGLGLLLGIGMFAYFLAERQPGGGDVTAIPAILVGVGIVAVGLVAFLRNR